MGVGTKNGGILNFALVYDLIVANTLFRKRVSHLLTFSRDQPNRFLTHKKG
jgi:hypothetical protein